LNSPFPFPIFFPLLLSQEARTRFRPEERGCYSEGELELKYLPTALYRYDISNCLFEATYEKVRLEEVEGWKQAFYWRVSGDDLPFSPLVLTLSRDVTLTFSFSLTLARNEQVLEICRCTPYFHWAGLADYPDFCRGRSLLCMNRVLARVGEFNDVSVGQGKRMPCLAACVDQLNDVAVTTSRLPNRQTFVERPEFCVLLRKLSRLCRGHGDDDSEEEEADPSAWKRAEVAQRYPGLCATISEARERERVDEGGLCGAIRQRYDAFALNQVRGKKMHQSHAHMRLCRAQRLTLNWSR